MMIIIIIINNYNDNNIIYYYHNYYYNLHQPIFILIFLINTIDLLKIIILFL